MKKIGIIFCVVLVAVFVFSLAVPAAFAQALGVMDTQWFEAKLKKSSGYIAIDGNSTKLKIKGNFYFKLCSLGPSFCDGFNYLGFAVVDRDEDGIFGPEDIAQLIIDTCGSDESSFYAAFEVPSEPPAPPELQSNFNGDVSSNLLFKSKGCAWFGNGGIEVGKKCKIRAKPIDVEELPFDPADLGIPPCPSELPPPPVP